MAILACANLRAYPPKLATASEGGIRIVAIRDLPKVKRRVRFPYPAPIFWVTMFNFHDVLYFFNLAGYVSKIDFKK